MKADAVKISEGVYWVGTYDWDIRSYHGYTLKGTTYNAYLVFGDEKVAVIDNVYPGTSAQMWGRIKDAFEKEGREFKIDVIVQNHVEKDHSGALVEITKKFPDAPIYCTEVAVEGLKKHYAGLKDAPFKVIKSLESVDLGGKTLTFLEAPLLHWPDSMFTLYGEEGILFSNDAFGQHLCLTKRFDNEIPENILMDANQKFYANLITPLSKLVLKKFNEVISLGLLEKITMIAPSHGQIWTDPMKVISAYQNFATGQCKDKATIVYDTMHYSTQKMAHAFAEGLLSEGIEVVIYNLHSDERSEIVKDILDSKAVLFGIPTINDQPFPSIGDLMYYLRGLRFDRTGFKKLALTFGSMGGRGGAIEKIANELGSSGFDVVNEYELYYIPNEDELEKCYSLGNELGKNIKSI
ncbi:FprA family A-type flavoprotein [Methanococcus maripaludis]|uniref:Flavorubredoxin n=1 Tax=Methanococcus maripaludis TaxID=39152 RepID=A0A8T4H3U7_METMI|nr:FprA family A-type flavoprotein [Methanococcus maripaludis]MBM7409170.1 flavorubredoxin [Methanococcus maripaludis]MBP2218644.1 flavorubredoxin [Methanococcus maripaludis]